MPLVNRVLTWSPSVRPRGVQRLNAPREPSTITCDHSLSKESTSLTCVEVQCLLMRSFIPTTLIFLGTQGRFKTFFELFKVSLPGFLRYPRSHNL